MAKGQVERDVLPVERVLRTFAHEAPDIFAVHHIGFSSRAASHIPGHEACGVLMELGDGVSGLRQGPRVVIEPGIPCGR